MSVTAESLANRRELRRLSARSGRRGPARAAARAAAPRSCARAWIADRFERASRSPCVIVTSVGSCAQRPSRAWRREEFSGDTARAPRRSGTGQHESAAPRSFPDSAQRKPLCSSGHRVGEQGACQGSIAVSIALALAHGFARGCGSKARPISAEGARFEPRRGAAASAGLRGTRLRIPCSGRGRTSAPGSASGRPRTGIRRCRVRPSRRGRAASRRPSRSRRCVW